MIEKKIVIDNKSQIKDIDFSNIDNYDFTKIPNQLRTEVFAEFLAHSYLRTYQDYYRKSKKSLSQNMYARRYLEISPMGFSTYKSATRMPNGENLDKIADKLGQVVYDIVGVPRKMPSDKLFHELASLWVDLNESEKKEVIEITKKIITKPPKTDGKYS